MGALTKALRDFPATQPDVAPSDAAGFLTTQGAAGTRWAAAAGAGLGLERWAGQDWSGLGPAAAWGAAGDLARIAAALPQLDGDLALRLPAGHSAATVLLDPSRHAAVRLGAAEVVQLAARGETSDAASAREHSSASPAASPVITRGPEQLPDGRRRLHAQLTAQPHLTPGDLAAAASALERVAAATALALRTAAPNLAGPTRAAEQLRRPLAQLVTQRRSVRGVSGPDPFLNAQAREIAGAADRLNRRAAPSAATPRVAVAALEVLPATVVALRDALLRSATNGGLAVANHAEDSRGLPLGPAWAPPRSLEHPDLRQLLAAADVASDVARPLVSATAVARGALGLPTNPARLAAAEKATALTDLSAAVARRPRTPTEPARPQRPNLRPGPAR